MNQNQPLVSIIITCYNDGEFLPVCVHSVEKIKTIPVEIIIVNNASSDLITIKVLNDFKESGLQVIDEPRQGTSFARNSGISVARAPYILLIDADDFIEPELVYEGARILSEDAATGVVYSDVTTFGTETGKRHLPDFDLARMLIGNYVYISSMFRKAIWEKNGGFDTNPGLRAHQDWDFWIRVARAGWHFHHLKKCVFHYRVRAKSVSSMAHDPEVQKEINKYITEKHAESYREHALFIIQSLKETVHELVGTVKMLDETSRAFAEKAKNLEIRINSVENSRLWKMRFFIAKVKNVLGSGDQDENGNKNILSKIFFFVSSKGRKIVKELLKKIFTKMVSGTRIDERTTGDLYQAWIKKNTAGITDLTIMKSRIMEFHDKPVISIFVSVNHPSIPFLTSMVESVLAQIYPHWELFLCLEDQTDSEIIRRIKHYAAEEKRVMIASLFPEAFNKNTSGDFVLFLGAEDLLAPNMLFEMVELLNKKPQADLIYTDEDQVDAANRRMQPFFKPDWSPDSFLAGNYISKAAVLRRSIINKIGGLRNGFEYNMEYELMLRFIETSVHIFHIPLVLYHKRVLPNVENGSLEFNQTHAVRTACKALAESIARKGEPGSVNSIPGLHGNFQVRYEIKNPGKVSVLIPTRNKADVLETCLKSIFEKTLYPEFEVVVIDNRSTDPTLFHLVNFFEKAEPDRFRCIQLDMDFNFSKLMNEAVHQCDGEYILLLNNDTEVLVGDWMTAMVEQAQRKSIGAVGAKLLYHNNTIQHAGVIIGIGGVADHAFVGVHKDGPSYQNYVNQVKNYSAVTAACLMCRRDVYEQVGGFDEGFAVEFNDVDFCLKIQKAGYFNIFLPHVLLFHYESLSRGHPKSSKESFQRHLIEVKKFQDRWKDVISNDPCFNPNFSRAHNDFRIRRK